MSMMTFWFVPMLPGLPGGTTIPTTLPVPLAEAEVDTPVVCCWNPPAKLRSEVPLERCWNAPLARQSTVIDPGGPPNVKKLGLQLLAAARQIAAGDRAAALQEAAEEERVALLDEVEQEYLGIVDRAALVDAQLPGGESSAPAPARVARRSRAVGREPADESRGAVRNEVRLVPRPTAASAGVARGRKARSWAGSLGRGRGGRVLARGQQVTERQRGAQTGKAEIHWCLPVV